MATGSGTAKTVAGSGAGFSAVGALLWWVVETKTKTNSQIEYQDKQDECATVTRVNNNERRKVALELQKLRDELVRIQQLLVEMADYQTFHSLHPKSKLAQPVPLTRAIQKIRFPNREPIF